MVTYAQLLSADPDQFAGMAKGLTSAIRALGDGEHQFRTEVAKPVGSGEHWGGKAAVYAHTTANAHVTAMSTVRLEMNAAAKALALYAADLSEMQKLMHRAKSDAVADGIIVHDDGSTTREPVSAVPPGTASSEVTGPAPDTVTIATRRAGAEQLFHQRRDQILKLVNEIDSHCAGILRKLRCGTGASTVDCDNTLPDYDTRSKPPDMDKIIALLNVDPNTGMPESNTERVLAIEQQLIGYLGLGKGTSDAVTSARKEMTKSSDKTVSTLANDLLNAKSKSSVRTSIARALNESAGKTLTAVDFVYNIGKYSEESHSVVEIGVKSSVSTALGTAGGAGLSKFLGLGCLIADAPDGESTYPECMGVTTLIGSFAGGALGGQVADKLNGALFHKDDGDLDPLIAEVKEK